MISLKQAIDTVQNEIASENKAACAARAHLKDLNEKLDSLKQEDEKLQRKLARDRCVEEGRKWAREHPEEHIAFMEDIRHRNQEGVIEGFVNGWWDLDDDGNMVAPAKVFHISDFAEVKNPLMAHVMAKAEIFTSVSQARKNGWNKPLTSGEWTVTKKRIRIRVEE